jgi:CheY-like chemotaxis protein
MPGVHGFQVIRAIRESSWNRSTPIIVVTGCGDRRAMEQAFDFGATFFLQKPVDTMRLLRLFKTVHGTLLDNRRRCIRVPFKSNVICQTRNARAAGTGLNLSQGGMLLEDGSPQVGDEMTMSFQSPVTNAMITVVGRIVRVDERQHVAVQFSHLKDTIRDQIRLVIEHVAFDDKPANRSRQRMGRIQA